jgi:hypothetical protein
MVTAANERRGSMDAEDFSEVASDTDARRRRVLENIMAMRSIGDQIFPAGLCRDLNLDLLLGLYGSHLEGTSITTRALAGMAGLEQGTALRRLYLLERSKLVERSLDLDDRRRSVVYLTESGIDSIEKFIDCHGDLSLSLQKPAGPDFRKPY